MIPQTPWYSSYSSPGMMMMMMMMRRRRMMMMMMTTTTTMMVSNVQMRIQALLFTSHLWLVNLPPLNIPRPRNEGLITPYQGNQCLTSP